MKNNLFFLAVVLMSILTQSSQCEKEDLGPEKNDLAALTITLDQTAWFCPGNCGYNFVFKEGEITTRRFDKPNDETPIWVCDRSLSAEDWQAIVTTLDTDKLAGVQETIGCPGCADEPIETLTVVAGDFSREIRMNMGTEVPAIQPLLDKLRAQAENYKDQDNCQ